MSERGTSAEESGRPHETVGLTLACEATIDSNTVCHQKRFEMLNRSQRNEPSIRLYSGKWWSYLTMALLFVLYVNYVPAHLATATHLNDAVATVLESDCHHHDHGHSDVPAPKSDDGHPHHPASEHELTLAVQSETPVVALLMVLASSETSPQLLEPEADWITLAVERIHPPGEPPPEPSQPRAPPVR